MHFNKMKVKGNIKYLINRFFYVFKKTSFTPKSLTFYIPSTEQIKATFNKCQIFKSKLW